MRKIIRRFHFKRVYIENRISGIKIVEVVECREKFIDHIDMLRISNLNSYDD